MEGTILSNLFQDDGPSALPGVKKVCLATTSYDNPDASYTFAIQRSRQALNIAGIQSAYYLLQGNCHVDDARNTVIQEFLLSDCTELVFLDADVSWRPKQLVDLCKRDEDIIGGVYPFRREGAASRRGMPVRMIEGVTEPNEHGVMAVEGLPAGFMKINREVLEKMQETAFSYWNREDRRSKVPILFERVFDPATGIRWGGDLHFCNKARKAGFRVWAIPEMQLGHTAKTIVKDSLGAALRRQAGTTLRDVARLVREGKETLNHISEAIQHVGNPYGALEDVLVPAITMARQADGPILETGSGLSTILMAAANPKQTVYCLENNAKYAETVKEMAFQAETPNVAICSAPIVDGWYDMKELKGLPEHFAFALHDGPSRKYGDRMKFFPVFEGQVDALIVDDIEDLGYREKVEEYAKQWEFETQVIEPRAMIMKPEKVNV